MADETGLPALLAILESLPAGMRAVAIAEVADDAERRQVDIAADAEIHWVTRDGRPPGTTTALMDALRGLELPRSVVRPGAAARRWRCATCAGTSPPSIPRGRLDEHPRLLEAPRHAG